MQHGMRIDVIDNLEAFIQLRPQWDAVYHADPEAQFFLSWTWMSKWLPMLEGPWFILAVKPDCRRIRLCRFLSPQAPSEGTKDGRLPQ